MTSPQLLILLCFFGKFYRFYRVVSFAFSALTLLVGGRKGIRPVKNGVVRSWCGICLQRGADLHMAQLMPLPLTVSCLSKIQIGFSFLVLAHSGSPGQRAIKRVCVCVCYRVVCYRLLSLLLLPVLILALLEVLVCV